MLPSSYDCYHPLFPSFLNPPFNFIFTIFHKLIICIFVQVGDKDAASCAGTDASVTKVTGYLVINFTNIPYQYTTITSFVTYSATPDSNNKGKSRTTNLSPTKQIKKTVR